MSFETSVALPSNSADAVLTSAAQSPARINPAASGERPSTTRGRASAGTIPGCRTTAAMPMMALMNPTGAISKPPSRYARLAVRSSRVAKPIWITAWVEWTWVIITMNQAAIKPTPMASGSNPGWLAGS